MFSFPSTVTLNPVVSEDSFHKITYGTHSHPSCKYAKKNQLIRDDCGKDVFSKAWIQFPIGTSIKEKDQIILPDGTTGSIVAVQTINYPHNGTAMCIVAYMGA